MVSVRDSKTAYARLNRFLWLDPTTAEIITGLCTFFIGLLLFLKPSTFQMSSDFRFIAHNFPVNLFASFSMLLGGIQLLSLFMSRVPVSRICSIVTVAYYSGLSVVCINHVPYGFSSVFLPVLAAASAWSFWLNQR